MKKTHELTRRQMLAAMAVSTVGGLAKGSVINQPESAKHLFSDAKSRIIKIDAKPQLIAIADMDFWPTAKNYPDQPARG